MTGVGHANYESPHSNPLALLPDGSRLYVANTPADTVDVLDTATNAVVGPRRSPCNSKTTHKGRDGSDETLSRADLLDQATRGDVLVTVTGRLGYYADYDHPQPTLRPVELPTLPMFPGGRPADFPELYVNEAMRLRGEHIQQDAYVLVDGRRVFGSVECEMGNLPDCDDDVIVVEFDELPIDAGLHLLQVQNPQGLFSNPRAMDPKPRCLADANACRAVFPEWGCYSR